VAIAQKRCSGVVDVSSETHVAGDQWLNVKMLTLAKALRFSVESCGFVSLARYGL
jgi:hypothetical protein